MSVGSWRDGYQRGFLDGVEMRKKWDDEHDVSAFDKHIAEVKESRNEWDEDYKDYFRAGIINGKTFDQVAFPDKCQECSGDCKVC